MRRFASPATSRAARRRALTPCASRLWRARTTIRAPPAPTPTTPATTTRPQRRGSRSALGSNSASSWIAASVVSVSRRSRRSLIAIDGSTGTSAPWSMRSTSLISLLLLQPVLQLLDRAVDEHLRGALRPPERPRDLLVVHAEREAHDQRFAPVVRQRRHAGEHRLELLASLHDRLRVVRGGDQRRVLELRLRPARAVAVVVRREVVRDADQPRPKRPAARLALRALEVPVGLEERLLREVLGVVVVARAVVAVAVDVAQVCAVQVAELAVEPGLVRHGGHAWSLPPGRLPQAAGRSWSSHWTGRGGCSRSRSQRHCSSTHGQIRSVTRAASRGEAVSTLG